MPCQRRRRGARRQPASGPTPERESSSVIEILDRGFIAKDSRVTFAPHLREEGAEGGVIAGNGAEGCYVAFEVAVMASDWPVAPTALDVARWLAVVSAHRKPGSFERSCAIG
jgi:hypothetical protein